MSKFELLNVFNIASYMRVIEQLFEINENSNYEKFELSKRFNIVQHRKWPESGQSVRIIEKFELSQSELSIVNRIYHVQKKYRKKNFVKNYLREIWIRYCRL